MTADNTHAHPLVGAYLRDLELLLHDLPPTERGEVLLGVRDHFDEALGANPTEAQVRSVLDELGPAVDIADEAHGDERAAGAPAGSSRAGSWTEHRLVPVVVAILAGLSYVSTAYAVVPSSNPWMLFHLMKGQAMAFIAATALLIGVSRLWTPREKVLWSAILPTSIALLFLAALPQMDVLTLTALALNVIAGIWCIVHLVRKGASRVA